MYPHKNHKWVDVFFIKFPQDKTRRTTAQKDDRVLFEFIQHEIPDSYFRNGNKELLIDTLKSARKVGASPLELFELLLWVHEQLVDLDYLQGIDSFKKLQGDYAHTRKAIISNQPYLFYCDDFTRPLGRRIMSAIDTLDELLNSASLHYQALQKRYKPSGRGNKKPLHLHFMGVAFLALVDSTECSCDRMYEMIASLLSSFSKKDYEASGGSQ